MPAFITRLKSHKPIAEATEAFYFERPEAFRFKAGQFINLTLQNPPETDEEGNVRPFTIASAPGEPNLMIATRMRNTAFKRVLAKAAIGTELILKGPFGSFVLPSGL